MKILYLSSALMLLPLLAQAKPARPTKDSLTNLMTEIRDPYFSSAKKTHYLQFAQNHMQAILAKELKTTPANLGNAFVQNPAHMNHLWETSWIELQTEFYTSLHQRVLQSRWDAKIKSSRISDYGKNIGAAMLAHLGKYSPVKEGQLYNRWSTLSLTIKNKKNDYRIPFFVFSPKVDQLTALDAHVRFEDILPKASQESPGHPSVQTLLRHSNLTDREDVQELAEKVALNHKIYIRAVANSAKTVASIHYLTGEYTLTQTEAKVASFLSGFCDGCSSKERTDYLNSAMAYVKKQKNEFTQAYTTKSIVKTFCSDLGSNGYIFDEPSTLKEGLDNALNSKPKPIDYRQQIPPMAVDNTRVDNSHIRNSMLMMKLSAVRKTVYEHDLGVLFLTKALSRMSSTNEPMGTNLGCHAKTESSDIYLVKKAISEARENVEKYIYKINEKIRLTAYSNKSVTETLEYFTQTNVSATGEAVMLFPQGINHVVESLYQIDRDVKRRKRVDTVVTWGGTIIGVGLAITGIGAPEGAAILLAVAAMTKGAIAGTYYLYRSQQEKAFYRELLSAKTGLGKNFYLQGNLSQHYDDYRNFRTSALSEYASSVMNFIKIHKLALVKSGGDVSKAHSGLRKVFERAKASGEEIGENELTEMVVSMVF